MQTSLFGQIINLIHALAKLAIPLVILIIILIFKKDISNLFARLKRGKIFGQEVELHDQLDKLSENISEGAKRIPESLEKPIEKKTPEKDHYDEFSEILKKAEKDPKEALNITGLLVEVELKNLVALYGLLQYFSHGFSFLKAVGLLQNRGIISKSTAISLRQFYNLRNDIIHAQIETSEEEMIRLIDLGVMLSNLIRSIPHETYEVHDPNIEIYRDKNCTVKYEYGTGLMLKVTSPGGKIFNYRIYPTTRTDYEKGQILSWEWDSSKKWGEAWYNSPVTGKIEHAWSSSLEFVGRPLGNIPIESRE
jgi:hypothetical protein